VGLIELLILLIIAGICGAIAEAVVGFSPGGCVVSIIVGVIGAYLGTILGNYLNLPRFFTITIGGQSIEIMWAILGSIVLLLVISVMRGTGRHGYRRW
jgi:uncharacterized membrane protein YeaQ/YmgE (transglycosylase-associated protein family)